MRKKVLNTEKNNLRHKIPIVALVGRPNVGKSSLFNRLIGKRLAITHEIAGTTRDSIYHHIEVDSSEAILVDTGGMEYEKKDNIEADMQSQSRIAINEADLILFVLDVSENLTANDYEAAQILRKSGKPIVIIANKFDRAEYEENIPQILSLGFGDPLRTS